MKLRLSRIDFACNDPDNGDWAGRVHAIDYGGNLSLEERGMGVFGRGLKLTVEQGRLRIHRRWFVFQKSKSWYGNWCWDAFWFHPREAKRLLRHLKASGHWHVDGGLVKLGDWFERAAAK